MSNDTIQSISIGLGLDLKQISAEASEAMRELDRKVPKRMERILVLRAKVDPSTAQIDNAVRQIQSRLNQNLAKALTLKPKFTVTGQSVTQLQRDVTTQLKQHPINVPIQAAKIDGAKVRNQILSAIGVPSIPFTWHWQGEPPPGGAAPAGGSPSSPRGGGGRRSSPAPATPSASPPTPTTPAALTKQPQAARSHTAPPRGNQVAAAPVAAPGVGNEGYTDRRGKMGPSPHQYTADEKQATLYERSLGNSQRLQTRGVRGARVAGTHMTAADKAAYALLQTPESQARLAKHRERATQIAGSINLGQNLSRRNTPDYQRARDIVKALKSVPQGVAGLPNTSDLEKILTGSIGAEPAAALADAWARFASGDLQGAGTQAKEALSGLRPFSGVNKVGKKLRRANDPQRGSAENAPVDLLLASALGSSIIGEETISENRDARVRRATRRGSKGFGPTSYAHGSGRLKNELPVDDKYLKALQRALSKPAPEMAEGETVLTHGLEKFEERPRSTRENVNTRRNRVRSDRNNYHQRLDAAKQRGLSLADFMKTRAGLDMLEGRAGGGLVEALLKSTLQASGTIKPGQEARSQHYNKLLEMKRANQKKMQGWYRVGELGDEGFVPEQNGWIIPHRLLDQLPKRSEGGRVNVMGKHGGFITPSAATGFIRSGGEITRVFVVNWPHAFTGAAAQQATAAGVPIMGNVKTPKAQQQTGAPTATAMPTGPAQPVGNATVTGLQRSSAQFRQEQKSAARDEAEFYANKIANIRSGISEQMQLSPVRALSVAMGQIMQTAAGGRGGILQRRDVAQAAVGRAQREATELSRYQEGAFGAEARIREAQQGLFIPKGMKGADYIAQLQAEKADYEQAQAAQKPRVESAMGEAEAAQKNILNKRQAVRAQAVGAAGIAVGTIAFTALMSAAQVAVQLFGKAITNAADAASGFAVTAAKTAETLAPATMAVPGSPRAGLAQQYARLGVNGNAFGNTNAFAARMAGSQNLQQVIDLMRTETYLKQQVGRNANVVPGLGTGFNNGPLNFVGLGQFGQTPGALEQLGGALAGGGKPTPLAALPGPLGWLFGNGAGQDYMSGTANSTDPNTRAGAEAIANAGKNIPLIGGLFDQWATNLKAQDDQQVDFKSNIKLFNDRIYRTIGSAATIQQGATPEQIAASVAAFKEAGNEKAGTQLAQQGLAVVGPNGAAATSSLVNMVGEAITNLLPSREELVAAIKPQISGQLASIQIQGQRQRSELLPTQFALQQIAHPFLAPGTGLINNARQGNTFGPGSSPTTSAGGAGLSLVVTQLTAIQKINQAMAQPGNDWLSKLPPEAQAAVAQLKTLGTVEQGLQTQMANITAGFSTEQMNRQFELAVRSAGDLVGLEGKRAETVKAIVGYDAQGNAEYKDIVVQATQLGKLQREQLQLTRTQSQFELSVSQRQINFQLAVSKLQVPGETPAEMAARVANAQTLADEAQKRHDFEQQAFDLSKQIQDVGISRDAIDAIKSLQELSQGQAVTIKTDQLTAALQLVQTTTSNVQGFVDSFTGEQQAVEQAIQDAWLSTETQMNSFQATFNSQIDTNLAALTQKYSAWLANPTGVAPSLPGATPTPDLGWTSHATGAWRTGDEISRLHAGEMVVPANAAAWMRASMMGATRPAQRASQTTVVQFNGDVNVRDDSDIDAIARKVEQAMNRRAAAVGLPN